MKLGNANGKKFTPAFFAKLKPRGLTPARAGKLAAMDSKDLTKHIKKQEDKKEKERGVKR
jgi:hypothetical protein